jgi:hypothetical protein
VDGLADAMVRALADPEHYARLCQGAWKSANRFTLENHLANLEPLLGLQQPSYHPHPGSESEVPCGKGPVVLES